MRPPAKCHRSLLILGVLATKAATQAGTPGAPEPVHPGPLVRRGTPTPSNAIDRNLIFSSSDTSSSNARRALEQLPSYSEAAIAIAHPAASDHFEQPADSQSQLPGNSQKLVRASQARVHSDGDTRLTNAGNLTWKSLRERARARSKRSERGSEDRSAACEGEGGSSARPQEQEIP